MGSCNIEKDEDGKREEKVEHFVNACLEVARNLLTQIHIECKSDFYEKGQTRGSNLEERRKHFITKGGYEKSNDDLI